MLYRLLLRCFPRAFRARHGAAMRAQFDAQRRALGGRPAARLALWLRAGADATRHGLGARLPPASHWRPTLRADALRADGRAAIRALIRQPAYALTAITTIALGIAVVTSLMTVVNELVLRPLPGLDQGGLVKVYIVRNGVLDGFSGHPFRAFETYAREATGVQALAASVGRGFAVSTSSGQRLINGTLASGSYFATLGTVPHQGRLLQPADDGPGGAAVAVVSHAFWQEHLGGDASAVGAVLRINGDAYEVVGVAEAGFRGPFIGFPSDIFIPLQRAARLAPDLDLDDWADDSLELVGRLATGTTASAAESELNQLAARVAAADPAAFEGRSLSVRPWAGLDADLERPVLGFVGVLGAIVVLVAGVAYVNVAGLMLHRGQARRTEFAVRQALGAGRWALTRQLVVETVALFAAGGALGVLMSAFATPWLPSFLPESALPIELDLTLDWRVLATVLTVGMTTGLVFGLAPALASTRVEPLHALRPTSAGSPRQVRFRRALVAAEFGTTLVLLIVAGGFARQLAGVDALDTGVRAAGVGSGSVDVRVLSLSEDDGRAFFDGWLSGAAADPRVERAALAVTLPFALGTTATGLDVEGRPNPPGGHLLVGNVVTPGYFDTLGIELLSGRDFSNDDRVDTEAVAIVSEAGARALFGDEHPIDRRVREGDRVLRVVGVAADVAVSRPGRLDTPQYYVPFAQRYRSRMWLVAAGAGPAPLEAIAGAAAAANPTLPLLRLQTLDERAADRLFAERMAASIAGVFGVVGLVLAAVGLYGVMAFQTSLRQRELAVRVALGAGTRGIRGLVLVNGLSQVGVGLAGGLVAAMLAVAGLRALVPGMVTWDPLVFGAAVAILAVTALVAADLPARRAATVDPMRALRLD